MPALKRSFPFDLLDVFAAHPLEGNLHAVIHDADGVPAEVMQRLAGRFRLSETSFVQRASAAGAAGGADYRHRILTMTDEVPFAGHPSLGTAAAVVRRRGAREATIVQETGAGLQRLEVRLDDPARAHVILEQPDAVFGDEVPAGDLLPGLGLAAADARGDLVPRLVSTGLQTLIVPVADAGALARIRVDWPRLESSMNGRINLRMINLYVVAEQEAGRWLARCFAQDIAGGEDPATGSAAGPLGAYLASTVGGDRFEVDQGVEMGQPSHITVTVDGTRPSVAGDVQFLAEGVINLPA